MDYETPQFYRMLAYAHGADRDVINMVSGSPDWGPPEAFREGLAEYAQSEPSAFNYGPSEGLHSLRRAIADRHGVPRDRIIVTNGAGEANHLAMTAGLDCYPGNEIVLADPVYPYYAGRASFLGAETAFVPVDGDNTLSPAAVRDAVSPDTAVIVVNSPNNPTGAVYDREAMAAFVEISEDVDALLVSDEVYDRFDYTGQFTSALAFDSENVAATNAVSKSMALTGARVGYGIFPDAGEESVLETAKTRHMLTNVTGSRPAQFAVARAFERTPASYYAGNAQRMADRIATLCDGLEAMGADLVRPSGGFYVLASLPGVGGTFEEAFDMVDEADVAAMPGEAFGEARSEYVRFAPLTPRVEEAVERLREYVDAR